MKLFKILLATAFLTLACTQKRKDVSNKELQTRPSPDLNLNSYNIAFLIMEGTYNTELTAPYDIFQHTKFRKGIRSMNTFTVANTSEPITTFEGVRVLPDFDYTADSIPQIDILVVPSAEHHLDTDLEDEIMLNFVRDVDQNALYVTSLCDGAFVLAKAGLLNNVTSTTFPDDIAAYRKMFSNLKVKDSVLFVHDGKYITSAGGAKSFEAALYLCEHLYGKAVADSLASGLLIDWNLADLPHLIVK